MANRIQGTTRLLGLIGDPIEHSKSPHIHNVSFEVLGIDNVYLAFEVENGHIKEAFDALKTLGAIGGNITMPHKTEAIKYLDDISPDAELIGSINTFKIDENKKVMGYNTDGRGLVKAIEEMNVDFKGKKVVIAGAGGAGKAIATQLAYEGAGELVIFNKTLSKAKEIVDNINKNISTCGAKAFTLNEERLVEEIQDASIVLNATSLGMKDTIDQAIISSPNQLPKDIFVVDIVYDPDETKLLKLAKERGCKYMNGLGMIIWQGAIAFKIWTDKDMPVDLVKKEIFGR